MWYLQVPSTSSLHRVRYSWIDGLILAPHRHQDGDGGSDAFEFWNYFFFFFMEAISCSAFDSCLAIADTWDEKESRWNHKKWRGKCGNPMLEGTSSSFLRSFTSIWALAASPASKAARCSWPSASSLVLHHHLIPPFTTNTFVFLPPRRRGWSCSLSWSFPFPHEEASSRFPKLELKQWRKFSQQALLFKVCEFSYSLKFRLDLSYKKITF